MCNLKRFALANVAAGFAVAAFGCASPVDDTSEVSSAQSTEEPREAADTAGRQAGQAGQEAGQAGQEAGQQAGQQPGQGVEQQQPGMGQQQPGIGQQLPGRELFGAHGPVGMQGPQIGFGQMPAGFPGMMDPSQLALAVEHMGDQIRAQIRENIMAHRAQMLARLSGGMLPGIPQGFPQQGFPQQGFPQEGIQGGPQQGVEGGPQQGVPGGPQQGVPGGPQQGVEGGPQQGVPGGQGQPQGQPEQQGQQQGGE